METALDFYKLEKIELGGIKGRTLSQQVVQIYNEFTECMLVFTNTTYDTLDINNKVCYLPP